MSLGRTDPGRFETPSWRHEGRTINGVGRRYHHHCKLRAVRRTSADRTPISARGSRGSLRVEAGAARGANGSRCCGPLRSGPNTFANRVAMFWLDAYLLDAKKLATYQARSLMTTPTLPLIPKSVAKLLAGGACSVNVDADILGSHELGEVRRRGFADHFHAQALAPEPKTTRSGFFWLAPCCQCLLGVVILPGRSPILSCEQRARQDDRQNRVFIKFPPRKEHQR